MALALYGAANGLYQTLSWFWTTGTSSEEKKTEEKKNEIESSSNASQETFLTIDQIAARSLKHRSWKPRALPLEQALEKMLKNSNKTILQHHNKDATYFATVEEALPSIQELILPLNSAALKFEIYSAENIGKRTNMEDTHFFKESDAGMVAGVFDGHNGIRVAQFAKQAFEARFFSSLEECSGNVHQCFELLCETINQEICSKEEYNPIGSTAVICFIDKKTRLAYTATLGDSTAYCYRKYKNLLKAIPLSCKRNWSSQKDADRAALSLNDPGIAESWPKDDRFGKHLRYPPVFGLNVSRAFGNRGVVPFDAVGTESKGAIFNKPKIAVNLIHSGDHIVISSDGLTDHVKQSDIIKKINEQRSEKPNESLASNLVDYAAYTKNTSDNVTAISIFAK